MIIQEQTEILQTLGGARRILILTKENPGYDEGASALALFLWLKKQGKERIDVHLPSATSGKFRFLPGASEMREEIQAADQFVIRINVAKTKAKELSYDVKDDVLEVRIKPSGGNFTPKDVSFAESSFGYDVIVTLGAFEFASLGPAFEQNRELFFNTPIINIDRHSKNVRFGQLNIVYLNATSLAEIIHTILGSDVTPEIAQCLLTGLIAATNSFQTPQVTPDTLKLGSDLIVAGAQQQEIIQQLYRTKDVARLKVWGGILSRMHQVDTHLVYSDIEESTLGAEDIDLATLVEDLVLASPEAHVVLFFNEKSPTETQVIAYARENLDVQILLQPFKPQGTRTEASCRYSGTREQAESAIVTHVREQMKVFIR